MTRVLHVFGRLNRGGAELRTLDVVRRLKPSDPEMEFVALSGLPGDLDDEIRNLGGKVHYCKLDLGFPWRFKRLLRDRRIDVVHSHVHMASGLMLRHAGIAGVPVRIAHFRSCGSGKPMTSRRWMQNIVMRHWMNRWATLILGNSHSSLSQGWHPNWESDQRCAVIHNGLDITPFKNQFNTSPVTVRSEFGWPERCPIAIHVGRMDPAKNHLRLLEIWAEMAKDDSSWRFLSVGRHDQPLLTALNAKSQSLGIASKLNWAGERSDVARLLMASEIMVFPSIREGLPGAVLEANAAGLPVVGSDIAPMKEIAQHLGNVNCMSLADKNSSWAAQVADFAKPTSASRDAALQAFEASVYSFDRCVQAHKMAWTAGTAADVRRSNALIDLRDTSEAA